MQNQKSFNKSRSFLSDQSPSMETSTRSHPHPLKGDEIVHFSHPQHPLAMVSLPLPFTCMGCKEYGAGKRFRCQLCNFELHDFCAFAPASYKSHPLHKQNQHQLVFCPKPVKGGLLRSKCDVCAKPTKGYIFRCSTCNFEIHPCCAMLSDEMDLQSHPHTLTLLPMSLSSASGDIGFTCAECKRKRSGWVYCCTVCDYHLHAVCAKNMFNGFHACGLKAPEKPSMMGSAARVALGFITGLIEGIGEGFGEVLIESIVKGKRERDGRRTE